MGGELLVAVGGHDGTTDLDSVEVYAHDDQVWHLTDGAMQTVRSAVGMAEFGGRVFVAGGSSGTQQGHSEVESFVVSGDADDLRCQWQYEPPLKCPRMACSLVHAAGELWALGGFDMSTIASVERLSSNGNGWIKGPAMGTPRCSFGAVELHGAVLALGGFGRSEEGALQSCEMHDARTGAWSPLPNMHDRRSCFAAAVVGPNRVMACGGHDGTKAKAEVEVFDIVAHRWERLLPMPTPRSGAAAAKVGDGVCVLGGYPDGFAEAAALNVAEMWNGEEWASISSMHHARTGVGAQAIMA